MDVHLRPAEQQIAVLKSEFDKQHSVPAILAEDAGVIAAVTESAPGKSLAISQKEIPCLPGK